MANRDILLTSDARIFIANSGGGCGLDYEYYACMKMGGVQKSYGEVTPIYCPGDTPGEFVQVSSYRGDESSWTTSLTGYKPMGARSNLQRMAKRKAQVDIQVHFGRCGDLSDFGTFDSAIIFEEATLSNYTIDGLGALNGGETAPVLETVNLSAARAYEVFCVKLLAVARDVVDEAIVVDVTSCPEACLDNCLTACSTFYAFRFAGTVGDPGGNSIIIMKSEDNGVTWDDYVFDVPTFDPEFEPLHSFHILCTGNALYVIGNEAVGSGPGQVYRIALEDLVDGEVTTYRRASIGETLNDVVYISGKIYAAGADGYIYIINPNSMTWTSTTLLTVGPWAYIAGLDEDHWMVASITGTINVYRNGVVTSIDCIEVAGEIDDCQISAIAMRSEDEWYVATCGGGLYCTADAGNTWSLIVDGSSAIVDIKFPTKNVGYYVTRSPCLIYRTIDGGNTWSPVRDYNRQVDTSTGYWHSIATCSRDPNVFVATGRIPNGEQEACSIPEDSCQHTCEVTVDGDLGILVSGQIC